MQGYLDEITGQEIVIESSIDPGTDTEFASLCRFDCVANIFTGNTKECFYGFKFTRVLLNMSPVELNPDLRCM